VQKSIDEPETNAGTEEREHQPRERLAAGSPGANYLRQEGDGGQRPRTVTDHLGLIAKPIHSGYFIIAEQRQRLRRSDMFVWMSRTNSHGFFRLLIIFVVWALGWRRPMTVIKGGSFMRRIWLAGVFSICVAWGQPAQPAIQDLQVLRLWSGAAPGSQGTAETDIPQMTAYLPRSNATDMTAVIVLPGGGYRALSMNSEGRQVANYLNSMGIAAFVLQYRLGPRYHHPVEIEDAQRALRIVRSHAGEWHIAQNRIGIVGFSAGGHLAATASTRFDSGKPDANDAVDRVSSRPDFAVLCYPVISMTETWTHQGSKLNLLGEGPAPELAKTMSMENAVTAQTPPTFIFQTNADTTVPAENSVYYYLALRKAGVPAEMHVFENGPHGVGLAMYDPALSEWPKLLNNWLRVHGFIKS